MSLPDGVYFDSESVALDIAFIESLVLTKSTRSGRPEPLKLLPPHRKLIANLLGWKRATGDRLYRRCYFSTARKNSKSTIAAALGLDLLVMDNEQSPEIYLAASTTDQASIIFRACVDFIKANAELSSLLTVTPYSKTIYNPINNGYLKALSSEGAHQHGKNPSAILCDELHIWSSSEEELWDALHTGSGARRQPLFVYLTTAGIDEYTICGKEYQHACQVRDGVIDDPYYLPLIWELPKDADWSDEKLFYLANPCIGEIVSMQSLIEARDKALQSPSDQTAFRRLNLNQWVSAKSTWIPLMAWDACKWSGEAIS